MSLVSTLAKVAIGIAVAKGVSQLAKNGTGSAQAGGAGRGTPMGDAYSPQRGGAGGGLADMMGDLLGGGRGGAGSSQSEGGLGGLFDKLPDSATKKASGKNSRSNAPSSIDDLLGGGGAPGGGGGLGDLLGAVLGGAAVGGAGGGLGGMLNKALTGKGTTLEEPTQAQELAAGLMLKVMIQAVKSDGELDDAEKQKLMGSLGEATQAEMKFVNAELSAPLDIDGLSKQIPRGMEAQAYMMSLMAINLDNRNEAEYLHAFAQSLDLEKDQVNAIHDHVKAPRLYT